MNKKIGVIVFIIAIIIIVVGIILLILDNPSDSKKTNFTGNGKIEEHKNVQYSIFTGDYCSCLTFLDNNEFSEYDCDSEPTDMPYSGEYYDKYEFNPNAGTIKFFGSIEKTITAKILVWEEDKLILKVLGSKQDKKCSTNNKDIYEYYAVEITKNGKEMKEYINALNKDNNLIIEFWDGAGLQMCNKKDKDWCSDVTIVSTKKIINQINDDEEYVISLRRDDSGNIKSVFVTKN